MPTYIKTLEDNVGNQILPRTQIEAVVVSNTNLVTNLNADLLDGQHGSYYLPATNFVAIDRYGFTNNSETTISFDGTNTFSLTRTGASFSYFRAGLLYTISANKTVVLSETPPAATGTYFIYIDGTNGDLVVGTGWTLEDTKVPVAIVAWNNSLTPKYFLLDERHTCLIDRATHKYEHLTEGTKLVSTGLLTGGTLDTTVDANKVIGIPETKIADEDLFKTLATLATPNGATAVYYNLYRTAATTWVWSSSTMPFKYTTTGFIEYDNNGTMTPIANIRFANTYIFASNIEGAGRFVILSGRSEFANESAALAESFTSFDMTGFPIPEGVAIYKLTWQGITNGGTGQCQLVAITRITNNVITSAVSQVVDHNSLANLQGGASGEYYHLLANQAMPVITANAGKVLAVNSGATALEWITAGGTGTVTSVAAGNGLNFTTITSAGSVTLGTPSTVTEATTNAVTTTSHTHAVTGFALTAHTHSTYDNATALTGASVYDEVTVTDGIVTGLTSRELTFTDIGAADATHTHGSITTDGAIGTTAGLMIKTSTAGALSALAAGTTSQFLRGDGTWQTPPAAANLTDILLTLGNYTIGFNSGTNKLEIKYIG